MRKISGPGGRNHKTATGEMVEGQGRFRVRCQSAWGHLLQMTGEKTSVHKPRYSAGDVTDEGQRTLVGRKRWLHHSERVTNSDSNAHVFSKSLRATFVEWSH